MAMSVMKIKTSNSAATSPPKGSCNVHSVLKILSSRLDAQGNIRDSKDVAYITELMREAVKLVDRCMFLNVLLSTKSPSVLTTVLDTGGWTTLHNWLQESKTQDASSFLLDLLKLYKQLPVTVELLRQNSCAKDIKQLVKCPDEQVAAVAKTIVARWMERVKNASKDSTESSKHSDKSSGHKSSGKSSSSSSKEGLTLTLTKDRTLSKDRTKIDDSDPSRVRTLCDSPDHITAKFNHQSLCADRVRAVDVTVSDDSNSSTSLDTTTNIRRPKTVKMIGSKIRSTGLELDDLLLPTKKKSLSSDKLSVTIKPPSTKKTTPEKRSPVTAIPSSLPSTSQSSVTVDSKPKIKVIVPKPRPPEIFESSGFMDALSCSSDPPINRRKRKLSTPASKTSSASGTVVPSSPDEKKPTSFYQDTMETGENAKSDVEVKVASATPSEDGGSSEDPNSVTTAGSSVDVDKSEDSRDASVVTDKALEENSLTEPASKKKKMKSVTWVEESKLCSFFYFQLDENERVNVNKVKDFAETRKHEQEMERQMMFNVRRMAHDVMTEKLQWRKPRLLTGISTVVVPGCNSKEREIQREREQGVLLVIYFSKNSIPDSAAEPEPEFIEFVEARNIPLTDETGLASELNYDTGALLPTPTTGVQTMPSLPPAIANLLASTAAQVQNNALLATPDCNALPQPSVPPSTTSNNPTVPLAATQYNVPPLHVFLSMPFNLQQQIFQSVPFSIQQQMLNSLPPPLQQQLGPLMSSPGPTTVPPPFAMPPTGVQPPGNMMSNTQGPFPSSNMTPLLNTPPNFQQPPGPGPMPMAFLGPPSMAPQRPPRMMMRGAGPTPAGRVCRHFLAGNCRFGLSCHNIHPQRDGGHESPH